MGLSHATRCLALLGAAAILSLVMFAASAQESPVLPNLTIKKADPAEKPAKPLGPGAKEAIHRPLPASAADITAKDAANRAAAGAEKQGARRPFPGEETALDGEKSALPLAPSIAGAFNEPGLTDDSGSPPDTTGAIGPTRFVQLVNRRAGIFNRTTGAVIGSGTLNGLAGIASTVNSFDPQIIWDPTTNRFYYVMDSIFSANDNRLSFGFSKTANPDNVTSGWCHYTLGFGTRFPD